MKASELRIGNWVRKKGSDTKIQVDASILNVSELINYQPIPSTPEILEKCGFVMTSINNPFFKIASIDVGRGRELSVHNPGTPNEIVFLSEKDPKSVVVLRNYDYDGKTYLHHLMNLFHALTGEELNYQP